MARQEDSSAHAPLEWIVSRRRFVTVTAAGLLAGGCLLTGCRRQDEAVETTIAEPEDPEPRDVAPRLPDREPTVRIRILMQRDSGTPITIGSQGQWVRLLQPTVGSSGLALAGPLTLLASKHGWALADSKGFPAALHPTAPLQFDSLTPDQHGAGLRLNDDHYPGSLSITSRTGIPHEGYEVINHVALERYLPGVIASELYNHWHEEAHAAQAVAARSFACAEHAWFKSRRHFDMTNTQASQVYAGSVTHQRSIEAVEQTRGMVIAHRNRLVPGYYSSCCGGLAARAIDAIGPNPINNMRPLHGRSGTDVCTAAPVADWTIERSGAMLTQRLAAFGEFRNNAALQDLQDIQSISVSAVNMHGRPTKYEIVDRSGYSMKIGAETVRHAANFVGRGLPRPERSLRSSFFTAAVSGRTITFDGHGFGHGVGMCQHGAQIQAENGAMHDAILKWYYPEATLTGAYG